MVVAEGKLVLYGGERSIARITSHMTNARNISRFARWFQDHTFPSCSEVSPLKAGAEAFTLSVSRSPCFTFLLDISAATACDDNIIHF